ncbi:CtsR family transcriptional regulator [Mechercharimyces sp. CAU 1602]|uniref:CtsR family transcriptional regulator n=1 Tax=Mechercharimyces sp. CAU 1602 TaxID=2973933 RepID=UPI00216275A4|nr:CtsR family transcriptional regulator [Mechercharimyces sp. CAU 1602]MCS1352481.1 CtsR family transcriptional regulator [Mechercharimyces sp. CAU 1602]
MSSISDIIERHLLEIMGASKEGTIEIKRSEVAELFQCVPSQINYVISTRFTVEKGYLVESKRGGGGYIRICKAKTSSDQALFDILMRHIGPSCNQAKGVGVIERMVQEGLMKEREALLMKNMISRHVLELPIPVRDQIRARMLRAMVATLFSGKGE